MPKKAKTEKKRSLQTDQDELELARLLREAQKYPGIREAEKVQRYLQPAEKVARIYNQLMRPKPAVSTSDRTIANPHKKLIYADLE